ncbi:MAG: hypothetical protein A4E29_01014 [Methanomassiliicoccales archaeon PtaB.Bin134]|nr:MAG: hypothetical protein A4E29_01014 [Methanomassiliicoccales archaeon PtaB.Bin134]
MSRNRASDDTEIVPAVRATVTFRPKLPLVIRLDSAPRIGTMIKITASSSTGSMRNIIDLGLVLTSPRPWSGGSMFLN